MRRGEIDMADAIIAGVDRNLLVFVVGEVPSQIFL
jgi:hypothetical protein